MRPKPAKPINLSFVVKLGHHDYYTQGHVKKTKDFWIIPVDTFDSFKSSLTAHHKSCASNFSFVVANN